MRKKRHQRTEVTVQHEHVPERIVPFESVDDVVHAAVSMFKSRQESDSSEDIPEDIANQWKQFWHGSIQATSLDVPLCSQFKKNGLNRLEREILMALILDKLGMVDTYISDAEDVLKYLRLSPREMLKGMRCVSEENRLFKSNLIDYQDIDDPLAARTLLIDPSLLDGVLNKKLPTNHIWPVKNQSELFQYMRKVSYALQKKSAALEDCNGRFGSRENVYMHTRRADSAFRGLKATLDANPNWPISNVRQELSIRRATANCWIIFTALLGKELGHIPVDDDLFQGSGLARAASSEKEYDNRILRELTGNASLRKGDWIQPCGGNNALISDDTVDLEDTEFELTVKAVQFLDIKPRSAKKINGNTDLREPKTKLSDLVYTPEVRDSLSLALTQSRNANILFEKWGLGEKISYGRGVTALFSGPPGTGKTASAEALAGELGKPLLVANYAKIQNCFVGQTEKNIVSTFREARQKDAVLLWDEADAMFYDRDSADRNWEVRDVNVLLQEIERFDGICILTTNRKVHLDKALERRISLKIEFDPPDQKGREAIFKKLLPKKLPLAKDVSFTKLSKNELSGGEIKNVILNAARIALHRDGSRGKVSMQDFERAVNDYKSGSWTKNSRKKIGFSE